MTRTIIVFILLPIVTGSEEVKCQMMPVETKEGLMGYCCMFPKAIFKQQFMHNPKSGYIPPLPIARGFRDMMYPNRAQFMNYANYPKESDNFQGISRTLHEQQPNSQLPEKMPDSNTNKEFLDSATSSNPVQEGGIQTFGIFEYPFTGSKESDNETIVEEKNPSSNEVTTAHSANKTNINLDNRNNVNVPKTCTSGYQLTKEGDCKPTF